jgi:succinyl-diaminopimelate desuccinylase
MGITPDGEYPVINGEKGLITETYVRGLRQNGYIKLTELSGGSAHNIVPAQAYAELSCSEAAAQSILQKQADKITCTRTTTGVRVQAEGVGAHGGSPQEGENAIGRLMQFLDTLPLQGELAQVVALLATRFGMEWDGKSLGIAMEDALSGPLTMNFGVIRGNEHQITMQINYRYPVTCRYEDCGPIVEKCMANAGFTRIFFQHKQGIYMPPESPLVSKLLSVYSAYTGQEAAPKCIGGGTYAKMMPNTLAFGPIFPGDEVREHKPDEYMELDRLMDNANILALAMWELAGNA